MAYYFQFDRSPQYREFFSATVLNYLQNNRALDTFSITDIIRKIFEP